MVLARLSYRIDISAPGTAASLQSLRFEEALGEPFRVEARVVVDDADLDPSTLLGRDATLSISRAPLGRRVVGVIRSVRETPRIRGGDLELTLDLVPAMALLALRRDTRHFQNQTVPEILDAVLRQGLSPYGRSVQLELNESYPRRELTVQYQESDLDFAHRLMEEEGITYAFDSEGDTEVVVLRDQNAAAERAPALPAEGVISYEPRNLVVDLAEPIHRFARSQRSVTTSVTVRDFDWTLGSFVVERGREGGDDLGRVREGYEHGEGRSLTIGDYDEGVRRYQANDAERQVEVRHEAARLDALVAEGLGRSIGFAAGRRFELTGHPAVGLDGDYLITRVVHESREAEELAEAGAAETYHNRFECIPFAVPFRPRRRTKKPRIAGMQTAIVTGPPGEEIHCDEWGRVKVRFHWDRLSPSNDTSSTWVRVQQSSAGAGWGSLFIPRVGMEVVVSFVDGDPDRPVITGTLYNGANPPPYDLPAEKAKTTIRSNSYPGGGGFNELRFDDGAGSEEVFFHAQHDLNQVVKHCETHSVGVNQTISIGANQTQTVLANQTEGVGANQSLSVAGDRTINVGGDFAEEIGGSATITISGHVTETFEAGETRCVDAGHEETITGGATQSITGGLEQTIDGGLEQTITGGVIRDVTGDETITLLGDRNDTVTGAVTHTVSGAWSLSTPETVTIEALAGFTLNCPAGGRVVAPAGWTVVSPAEKTWIDSLNNWISGSVHSVISDAVDIKGLSMSVTGVSLSATGVSASMTGLSLSLTDAEVSNEAIKLRSAGAVLNHVALRVIQSGIHLLF